LLGVPGEETREVGGEIEADAGVFFFFRAVVVGASFGSIVAVELALLSPYTPHGPSPSPSQPAQQASQSPQTNKQPDHKDIENEDTYTLIPPLPTFTSAPGVLATR
jgi:hypothetical protein